ncbi:MAG: hypothetical protein U9R15_16075 [Chloroflexota bacterium]|nr:hypothetical protein [Chloroflexota bacterium]
MRTNSFSTPPQLAANQRTQPAFRRLAWTLVALVLATLMTTVSRASIAATDPDWHGTTPENISNSSYGMVREPDIAIGPAGQTVAVWSDGPSRYELDIYVTDNSGGAWAIPQLISDTTSSSWYPDLLVAGGNIFVAWADTSVIHEAKRTGEIWQVRQIPSPVPLIAASTQARLAASTDRLHVVFNASETGGSDIYHASRLLAETTWPTATCVYTSTAQGSWSPVLAIDPDGQKLCLVWQEQISVDQNVIMYASGTVAGDSVNWSSAITLSTGITQSLNPDVAVDSGGNVHIVWGEPGADGRYGDQYVRYTRYDANLGFGSVLARIDSLPVQMNQLSPTYIAPSLALWEQDNQVTVCVVWHGFRSGGILEEKVLLSCSPDGGLFWASPQNVSRSSGDEAISTYPSITFDTLGMLHSVWKEQDEIYHSRAQHLVYLPLVMRNG